MMTTAGKTGPRLSPLTVNTIINMTTDIIILTITITTTTLFLCRDKRKICLMDGNHDLQCPWTMM